MGLSRHAAENLAQHSRRKARYAGMAAPHLEERRVGNIKRLCVRRLSQFIWCGSRADLRRPMRHGHDAPQQYLYHGQPAKSNPPNQTRVSNFSAGTHRV